MVRLKQSKTARPTSESAIHEIVEGRARAAHHDGAEREQRQMDEARRLPDRDRGEGGAPPAGAEQQLPADGTIDARQLNIGSRKARPAPERRRGGIGEAMIGHGWPVGADTKRRHCPDQSGPAGSLRVGTWLACCWAALACISFILAIIPQALTAKELICA